MGNAKSKGGKKGGVQSDAPTQQKQGQPGELSRSASKQNLIDEAKQEFQEGNNFFRDRKFDEAKKSYTIALEKLTRCDRTEKGQKETLTLSNLAALEFAEGRYQEAKGLLQKALEERRRAIEEAGERVSVKEEAGDNNNLTSISLAIKRDLSFRQLPDSERRLAGEIKEHATIDAMTSDLFNNLAACCEVIGDLQEARQFYEESLALRKLVYGERTIKVAESLQNIATILDFQGHQKEAEELLEQALDIEVELYGSDSVESSVTLNNLAVLCEHLGKLDQSQNLLERCVTIRTNEYGPDHHYTQSVKQNLEYVMNKKSTLEEGRGGAEGGQQPLSQEQGSGGDGDGGAMVREGNGDTSAFTTDKAGGGGGGSGSADAMGAGPPTAMARNNGGGSAEKEGFTTPAARTTKIAAGAVPSTGRREGGGGMGPRVEELGTGEGEGKA